MTETVEIPAWVDLILHDIAVAYPGLDAERLRQVRLKLPRFDSGATRAGWDEYFTRGGDAVFNVGRFFAIVNRHFDERRQRQDLADRQNRAHDSALEAQRNLTRISQAEKMIAEMNEEEVAAEWAKIEKQLTPAAKAMFDKYTPAKRRSSGIFKAHISEMMRR